MAAGAGFSVRIFMPTGEPEGLRIIEKSMWTGLGLSFPRSLTRAALQRPELKPAGVYILWGPSDTGRLPCAYVGESDGLQERFSQHTANKDFWTYAVIFTSKDQNLNKAHVQYLEARLVDLAKAAKRCELKNGNTPQLPSLSAADAADADSYLADMLLCLPVLGINWFEIPAIREQPMNRLILESKGATAYGVEVAEGFVVQAGSLAIKREAPSIPAYLTELRKTLIHNGVFEDAGEFYRLTQDYTFNSPSSAGAVMLGRASNGRIDWKDANGRTLKEIQDSAS